jgi:hypothetical protein
VEDGGALVRRGLDADGAAHRGVADGVVQEVVEGAAAFAGGHVGGRERGEVVDHGHVLEVRGGAGPGERVGDGVAQVHLLAAEPERSAVDPGEFEQVVDEDREPLGVGADLRVVPLDGRVVVDHAVVEGLGHGADRRQRCPQVVGDPGDELAPGGFEGALASPGLLQPPRDVGEFPGEGREFAGAGDGGGAPLAVAVDHGAGVGADLLGSGADVVTELPGGAEGDAGGDDEDHEQQDEVVEGDEHRERGGDDAGRGDQDRGEGDGHRLDAGAASPQAAQDDAADGAGDGRGDRGGGDQDRDVARREVEGDREGGGRAEGDGQDQQRARAPSCHQAHQGSHR